MNVRNCDDVNCKCMNYETVNCELLSVCEIVNAKGNRPRAGMARDSGHALQVDPARKSAHRVMPGPKARPVGL